MAHPWPQITKLILTTHSLSARETSFRWRLLVPSWLQNRDCQLMDLEIAVEFINRYIVSLQTLEFFTAVSAAWYYTIIFPPFSNHKRQNNSLLGLVFLQRQIRETRPLVSRNFQEKKFFLSKFLIIFCIRPSHHMQGPLLCFFLDKALLLGLCRCFTTKCG